MSTYIQLVHEYLKNIGIQNQEVSEDVVLDFEVEDLRLQIYRHPQQEVVFLDVEIFELGESDSPEVQAQRLLLLHQLNALTRFTHGCLASVSPDRMLLLSRTLPLDNLRAEQLQQAVDDLLDRGEDLRDHWRTLSEVVQQTSAVLASKGRSLGHESPQEPISLTLRA